MIGSTPLHDAVNSGNVEMTKLLIASGADVNARDDNDRTPLHNAVIHRRLKIAEVLIKAKAFVNERDRLGDTPLSMAIKQKKGEIEKLLRQAGGIDYSVSPFPLGKLNGERLALEIIYASANGKNSIIEEILKKEPSLVNFQNKFGDTPILIALEFDRQITALLLLNAGANARAQNREGFTPLHFAASQGNPEVLDLLIKKGADVNAKTKKLVTPLHLASSASCVKILSEAGADVNARDDRDLTPLHRALILKNTEVCKALLKKGASPMLMDKEGNTALHMAVSYCNSPIIIKMLIERGAKTDRTNNSGETPLSIAETLNETEIITLLNGGRNRATVGIKE